MENNAINTLKAHVAINVRNVGESIDFYKKMLGIEPAKVRTGYAKFDVQSPPLNLTLNEVPFAGRGALFHLGIQVASTQDVLAMRELWADRGLITRDEMQTDCCYAVQDKTWVHDPDGNEWEVFVVLEDGLPEAEERSVAACCAPAGKATEPVGCGCEAAPPALGEPACCETQAAKFGVPTRTGSAVTPA
jgi:catechol 2,3-dioxygenase-like lactoylglutathione lyase family enzyme